MSKKSIITSLIFVAVIAITAVLNFYLSNHGESVYYQIISGNEKQTESELVF